MDYLFVYGTLMHTVDHEMSRFLQANAQFVGHAHMYGQLYEIDGYPGAVASENTSERVYGHLFRITDTDSVFKVLDAYEGIGVGNPNDYEYQRTPITVYLEDGTTLRAWFYAYNFPTDTFLRIVSGRYLE